MSQPSNTSSPHGHSFNNESVYIIATAAVSPQASYGQLLTEPANYAGDKLQCIEPDYSKYVDAKLIRRMSRIIKMGVAAAMETLQASDVKIPDAIITATAYGCLADTDAFLTRMIEFNEELLSPTAFIQSTHNTVGAQIALMLQCHNYNNTYVHRGSSFEVAMIDAFSLLKEDDAENVLIGGVDEIIEKSHAILKRFGLYKDNGESLQLIDSDTEGTMAGEGAAFFLLSKYNNGNAIAKIDAFKNYYKPLESGEVLINKFLADNNIKAEDIDLVILGNNGDARYDGHYSELKQLLSPVPAITYKQFCGEYPTSSAFALWMAANILQSGKVAGSSLASPEKILLYNNYIQHYPSLFLLSAC